MLFCKGADTTVYERLHEKCADLMEITTSNLNVSEYFLVLSLRYDYFTAQCMLAIYGCGRAGS
jgi:hypothetical protein